MASIDRTGALAAMIRAQLAAQRESRQPQAGATLLNPAAAAKEPTAPLKKSGSPPEGRLALDTGAWVAQQVKHLSPDDPRRRRKAFRFFLEAVLGQEFGPELAGSSSFDQLVGQVLAQMEADAELTAAMDEAGDQLLAEAGIVATG
jgi:hypothetical protein